jgi:hypothetical protein
MFSMQCACATLSSVDCPAVQYFFKNYLIKVTIFEKQLPNIKCVFWFTVQRSSETFPIPIRTERDHQKCILAFMCSTRYSCQIVMNLDFSGQIFEKYFMKICSGKTELLLEDRRSDMTKLIVAFWKLSEHT